MTTTNSAITTSTNSAWVQAAKHVATLFPAGSLLPLESMEVRCFKGKQIGPRGFYHDHGTLIRDAIKWGQTWDTYIGIGTRSCPDGVPMPQCPHKSPGAKDHVGRIPASWVEIDLGKPYETIEQIMQALDDAGFLPDLVVSSGGGLHCYFMFDVPSADFAAVERINRARVKRVGRDAAIDVSRVLRLAGTLNFKYGEPRPAEILCRKVPDAVEA